jgi:hypothetical protein
VIVQKQAFFMEADMIVPVDYKSFQKKLNAYCPNNPYSEDEATEAFHNLVGYVKTLMEINERIRLSGGSK